MRVAVHVYEWKKRRTTNRKYLLITHSLDKSLSSYVASRRIHTHIRSGSRTNTDIRHIVQRKVFIVHEEDGSDIALPIQNHSLQ